MPHSEGRYIYLAAQPALDIRCSENVLNCKYYLRTTSLELFEMSFVRGALRVLVGQF